MTTGTAVRLPASVRFLAKAAVYALVYVAVKYLGAVCLASPSESILRTVGVGVVCAVIFAALFTYFTRGASGAGRRGVRT